MDEKPILFSGEMVRAILAGRKTRTRRLYKLPRGMVWYAQLGGEQAGWYCSEDHGNNGWWHVEEEWAPVAVGDRLWVRETHHISHANAVIYRADYFECDPFSADECGEDCSMVGERWRPSIHMPRWASRITLEVTGVRIEKLQDITEEDAIAEGSQAAERVCDFCGWIGTWEELEGAGETEDSHPCPRCKEDTDGWYLDEQYRKGFQCLWESINGPESWAADPWVWVYEFERKDGDA